MCLPILLCLVFGSAQITLSQGATEYQLKAAFLFNFAKFVQWPPQAFSTPSNPFGICVYGKSPIWSALQEGLAGKTLGSRAVTLRETSNINDAKSCQVLFIGHAEDEQLKPMFAGLADAHVLTIGETSRFTNAGGMITFVIKSKQLRFVINTATARTAGLTISARLLSLAQQVKR